MEIVDLEVASIDKFLRQNPVTVLLFLNASESRQRKLLIQMENVAESFRTGIGFGLLNLDVASKKQFADKLNVSVTPHISYFRGARPLELESTGFEACQAALCRKELLHWFGKLRSGAQLIE